MKVIYNYIRAWFWGIIEFNRISRIKHTLHIDEYQIYIDAIVSHPRYYTRIISNFEHEFKHRSHNYKPIVDGLLRHKDRIENKSIESFFEVCILSGVGNDFKSYINKFEIKSVSDIRDEKISKLLSNQ